MPTVWRAEDCVMQRIYRLRVNKHKGITIFQRKTDEELCVKLILIFRYVELVLPIKTTIMSIVAGFLDLLLSIFLNIID